MPDSTIEILIQGTDGFSGPLQNAQNSANSFGQSVQKQQQQTSDAFKESTGSLLVLGQAASSVDHIFSSYENIQLRIQNASERVINAQDHLKDAQYNLNKMMTSGTATSYDLAHAQDQVDRATRMLTISQNNFAKTQNQVIGLIINMGVQVIFLITLLPTLITSINTLVLSMGALEVASGGIIILVGALVAGYFLYKNVMDQAKTQMDSLTSTQGTAIGATDSLTTSQSNLNDQMQKYTQFMAGLNDLVSQPSAREQDANKAVGDSIKKLADLQIKASNDKTDAESKATQDMIAKEQIKLETLRGSALAIAKYEKAQRQDAANSQSDQFKATTLNQKVEFDKQILTINSYYDNWKAKINETLAQQILLNQAAAQQAASAASKAKSTGGIGQTIDNFFRSISGDTGKKNSQGGIIYGPPQNDFIMRPGQAAVPFSSSDTIVGSKGGTGMNITITGNIYGTDPDEIASAILDKVRNKITLY